MSLASGIGDSQGFASTATLCNSNVTYPQGFASMTSGARLWKQDLGGIKVVTPGVPAILSCTHAVTAQSASATSFDLDWIADSGAGRDLGSEQAFMQQGIPKNTIQSCIYGVHPTKFETGNRTFTSDTCVELQAESFGQARFNMMNDCPLVRSLGQIVSSGKPFLWMPGELPFFANSCSDVQIAADESQVHHAQRVEDFVTIFKENLKAVAATPIAGFDHRALAGEAEATVPLPQLAEPAEEADEDRFVDEGQGGEALMREAMSRMSLRHRMCHMPKNPYCEVCRRARMYKSKTTKLRHNPLESRGHFKPVSKFGERLACDFTIVNKSWDGTKESFVQVIRDEHSGFVAAFPSTKHDTETVTRNLLAFLGPSYHTNPVIMCKSDSAKEFQASCNVLGFVH